MLSIRKSGRDHSHRQRVRPPRGSSIRRHQQIRPRGGGFNSWRIDQAEGGGQHWAESAARGLRAAGGRFQESLPACGREAGPTKSTQVTWVDPEPGLGLGGHPGLFVCCQTQAAPGPATAVCGPLPPRPTLTLHKTRPPFSFLYTYPTCHRPSAYLECRRHLCP